MSLFISLSLSLSFSAPEFCAFVISLFLDGPHIGRGRGETRARVRAARDYGNRTDRPVNTCENARASTFAPSASIVLSLSALLSSSEKSDLFIPPHIPPDSRRCC
ncbi:hypothetical protein ACFW04_005304 [Cataglyphis niger]